MGKKRKNEVESKPAPKEPEASVETTKTVEASEIDVERGAVGPSDVTEGEVFDEPGLFSRWFDLVFSPEKTFSSIGRRPVIAGALLLVIIFSCGFNYFFLRSELVEDLLYEQFMENPQTAKLTEAQIDQALWFSKNIGPVMPLLTVPILALFTSGLLYIGSVILFSARATFRQIFSTVCHVMLIMPLQNLFGAGLVYSSESFTVGANLLIFFPDLEKGTFLFTFLQWMNFFTLWMVVLLATGLASICRWRSGKTLVFFILLYLALAASMAGVGTWFAGMGAH